MRTIRGRLFLSLFLVMCFSIAVTIGLFSRYIYDNFRDQSQIQLQIQLEKALEVLDGGEVSDLDDTDLQLRFKNRFFTADYAVLDMHNRVVKSSNSTLVGKKVSAGESGTTGKIQLNGQAWLYTVDDIDDRSMRLMLFTPLNDLQGFHRKWIGLSATALAASTLFIFMIGFLFIWNTTRPLHRLKRAVNQFQPYQNSVTLSSSESRSEIGQLMHTFQSMAERIRNHHEHQINFLHQVSHELRTPLMSIQGYALAIKDQVVSQDHAITVIRNESQRLIQMVDRLLELTRLESMNEDWEVIAVDLFEMAQQTVQIIAPLAAERQIAVKIVGHEGIRAEVPAEQMFQVLLNLVQNAIRHAASEVQIGVFIQTSGWLIEVEDDGAGVPESLRETIFSRFYKGIGGGMGLGLTICRQIADRMGATIVCGTSSLGGASFRFRKGPE